MKKVVNIEKTDSDFEDYILFDIETTGLNRTKDFMYMFGICEKKGKDLIHSQYYIEDEAEEKELILKVKELLNSKKVISYNGDRFDFPFIRKKMEKYNITKFDFENIDIYRQFQKLNFFLDEPSLKAISLGKRLGFDVHELVVGRDLIIGGVKIEHDKGLLGHSDADVLVHAINDAIIGALCLGDIGKLFPDNDPKYKDISSLIMTKEVIRLMKEKGYKIGNVDSVICAQKPKLAGFTLEMRNNISKVLETDIENISIKATTTEHLGFEGREEGISSHAVVLLEKI